MGLESNISAVVAALDLKVVQLLRAAIRVADLSSGKGSLGKDVVEIGTLNRAADRAFIGSRYRLDGLYRFYPRPVILPTPRFEPRPVIPVEPMPQDVPPMKLDCPLQPPWKMPLWECPLPQPPVQKPVVFQPDIATKGLLLDRFV